MPFGAEVIPTGGVRFRLWAPSAKSVDVVLIGPRGSGGSGGADRSHAGAESLPMIAQEDGWYELETARAHAGSLYRYRIDGATEVPDPASRFNPQDVGGPSEVIDPHAFRWTDSRWRGHSWAQAVIYELHIGTFTPEGTFRAAIQRLPHLKLLGVTMVELMPIAEFPGARGWGYDGVLPYAPESAYGRPEDLKALIDAAHGIGLSVLVDVVYNHFGPEGNYLGLYAKPFFTERHQTPWGAAINFDGAQSRIVRELFIQNTLYWLREYHFDGLRFDAIHAICDDSPKHVMIELSERVRAAFGPDHHVHLILENGANQAHFLGAPGTPGRFEAQWNDDTHHCFHVLLTGEKDGYYSDYRERTFAKLARCLTEGFAYQGERSEHEGKARGEPSRALPPTAFVNFLQNHDQIGNRAFGDRLISCVRNDDSLHAALAILLLSPFPPMLFMGEEWGAKTPFPYFCDFHGELARLVRDGRRREFAHFERFSDASIADSIPDPGAVRTFDSAKLRWNEPEQPAHRLWLDRYRAMLEARQRFVVPELPMLGAPRVVSADADGTIEIDWTRGNGGALRLSAHLSEQPGGKALRPCLPTLIYSTHPDKGGKAWCVRWSMDRA